MTEMAGGWLSSCAIMHCPMEFGSTSKVPAKSILNYDGKLTVHCPCQAYYRAIGRVVKMKKAEGKGAHVLDVGSGTGLFGMMAARAGADSVVANDLSEVLCTTARRVRLNWCLSPFMMHALK